MKLEKELYVLRNSSYFRRYELRIIIWNTDSIPMDEVNIMGEQSSDIYVKG